MTDRQAARQRIEVGTLKDRRDDKNKDKQVSWEEPKVVRSLKASLPSPFRETFPGIWCISSAVLFTLVMTALLFSGAAVEIGRTLYAFIGCVALAGLAVGIFHTASRWGSRQVSLFSDAIVRDPSSETQDSRTFLLAKLDCVSLYTVLDDGKEIPVIELRYPNGTARLVGGSPGIALADLRDYFESNAVKVV
jgi:hypothetical protein